MFDRLWDWLAQARDHILPFVVIIAYQNAGVFRWGKYHRTLKPGFHWKVPFIDEVVQADVCATTMRMPPQTLTTKDGKSIVAAVVVNYEIFDVRPYLCDITDQKDVLIDNVMGAVLTAITSQGWQASLREPPVQHVVNLVHDRVRRYGIRVNAVTFTDLGEVKSIRLIQPHGKDLAN
jgi:membrane protease subunit HflK